MLGYQDLNLVCMKTRTLISQVIGTTTKYKVGTMFVHSYALLEHPVDNRHLSGCAGY